MDFAKDRHCTLIERAPLSMPRAVIVAAAVGVAFGLGVVSARAAGNDVVKADHVVARGDAVARAEARTKAYESVVKSATSTWHAELTSKETMEPAVLPTKFTQPVPVVDPSAVVADAVVEQPSSSPTVDADVVRAVEPVEVKVARAEVEPAARASNEDRDDQEGDADVTAPKPERLAAALSKVLGEKGTPATAAVDNRRYAVQLASTPKKDSAASAAAGFVQKGFAAKVVAAEVPGKGTMYRVRVSGLATRAAADAMKARIGSGLVVTDD